MLRIEFFLKTSLFCKVAPPVNLSHRNYYDSSTWVSSNRLSKHFAWTHKGSRYWGGKFRQSSKQNVWTGGILAIIVSHDLQFKFFKAYSDH